MSGDRTAAIAPPPAAPPVPAFSELSKPIDEVLRGSARAGGAFAEGERKEAIS
jgi:hypothetical protein